jgi:hypothetical protein
MKIHSDQDTHDEHLIDGRVHEIRRIIVIIVVNDDLYIIQRRGHVIQLL